MTFTELWELYMSRKKKKQMPMMDHETIYMSTGIYKPIIDMYVPHNNYLACEDDMWKKDEHFLISKHTEIIGRQPPYQYYAIKKLGVSKHYLVKSYETERWNTIAQLLERVGMGF